MILQDLEKLYDDFGANFPLDKLKVMTLEQYTNLDKEDSFCYWLESITTELGSIWGGSSYKFGIYKRRNNVKINSRSGYLSNEEYAWVEKYGTSINDAFEKVRSIIIEICIASQEGRFEDIDNLDLGGAYKWKIAYLYSNRKLVGIFNRRNLSAAVRLKDIEAYKYSTISSMHSLLVSHKPEAKSILEFSAELWKESLQQSTVQYWLYAPGEKAHKWDQFYDEGIMALGWDELDDLSLLDTKADIKNAISEAYSNTNGHQHTDAANYDFCHNLKEGDLIFAKDGKSKIIGYGVVASNYYYADDADDYLHRRKVDWKEKGSWNINHNMIKTLTNITNLEIASDISGLLKLNNNTESQSLKLDIALNTILCGPPGTGKTYRLQTDYASMFTRNEHVLTKEQYISNIIKDLTWWDVIALVLYETGKVKINDICNNEYIKIKASFSKNNTVKNTISRILQTHAKKGYSNITSKQEPLICEKHENYNWSVDKELLEESMPEIIKLIGEINNYVPVNKVDRRYEFITFHQKYSYEDFIVGIAPVLNNEEDNNTESSLSFKKKYGIFYNCCEDAIRLAGFSSFEDCYQKTQEERAEMFSKAEPYAIFIDEINRANISAVFGELISCIEDDKRIGAHNELWVKLPLEGGVFGVPLNLHVIGTMNTADRSIAQIDIALRRRFEFERMLPNYDVIPEWAKSILRALNQEIFKLKRSADFFIGHSFFMNKNECDSTKIFDNKIIPLLYEYFQNDTERVKTVLESAGIETKNDSHILEFVKIK